MAWAAKAKAGGKGQRKVIDRKRMKVEMGRGDGREAIN